MNVDPLDVLFLRYWPLIVLEWYIIFLGLAVWKKNFRLSRREDRRFHLTDIASASWNSWLKVPIITTGICAIGVLLMLDCASPEPNYCTGDPRTDDFCVEGSVCSAVVVREPGDYQNIRWFPTLYRMYGYNVMYGHGVLLIFLACAAVMGALWLAWKALLILGTLLYRIATPAVRTLRKVPLRW